VSTFRSKACQQLIAWALSLAQFAY